MADPITINDTVDVVGLDNIKADLKLELPQPLKTDSAAELTVNPLKADLGADLKADLKADLATTSRLEVEPLKTDSSLSLDLKPAVVDLCVTLNVGKLPNVCIRQPYRHHIGFTMWGTEVWGFSFSGEQETVIQEQHPQPRVALGRVTDWAERPEPRAAPERETGGLRIRLGP
jgi:hypothetical protein